jgi:hypothetical protein
LTINFGKPSPDALAGFGRLWPALAAPRKPQRILGSNWQTLADFGRLWQTFLVASEKTSAAHRDKSVALRHAHANAIFFSMCMAKLPNAKFDRHFRNAARTAERSVPARIT